MFRGWWMHVIGSQQRMLALQVITPGDKTYPTMNGQRLHFHSQAWHQSPGILKEKITRTLLQDNLGVADPSLEEEDEHTSWHIYLTDLPWGYRTHIQEFILVPASLVVLLGQFIAFCTLKGPPCPVTIHTLLHQSAIHQTTQRKWSPVRQSGAGASAVIAYVM